MGKVGPGYHTEFDHFARGAAAHDRRQALEVGEALVRAGLLIEKPSVGQRHISLNVRALPRDPRPHRPRGDERPAARGAVDAPLRRPTARGSAGTVMVTTGTLSDSVTAASGGESPRAA